MLLCAYLSKALFITALPLYWVSHHQWLPKVSHEPSSKTLAYCSRRLRAERNMKQQALKYWQQITRKSLEDRHGSNLRRVLESDRNKQNVILIFSEWYFYDSGCRTNIISQTRLCSLSTNLFFRFFFNALNLNKDQHLISFAQYYCWFIYWDIRHQVNDRQPEKLWLWNKFSTSVSKEMYREVYGVDSDVKMKQVNITIY